MTPLHQNIGERQYCRLCEDGESVMERNHVIQESRGVIVLPNLPNAGVQKGPAHHNAQGKNKTAVEIGFSHGTSPLGMKIPEPVPNCRPPEKWH